jgi:hypothetical protein
MSTLNEIFGSGFDLYKFLSQKSNVNNITKRLIYREIRNNMRRLEHRNKKGVNLNVLINRLENTSTLKAIQEGFDFRKLAPKMVINELILDKIPAANRYRGWRADKIISSIDEKLVAIKDLTEIYPDLYKAPINITKRLNNLYLLYVILAVLIKATSKS